MAGMQEDESSFGPRFFPPVYSQRYNVALDTASKVNARTVVDMGCAECKLLALMRRRPHVEELIGVDIDVQLLRSRVSAVEPLTTDYLNRRERPLRICLMQGSIAEPDQRLVDCDLLTCIEVIEHLEVDVLKEVPHSIFGVIRPKVAVVTTPNADFNVLFPNLCGFRHHDHKFEWTRAQFQSWCSEVAERYGYSVEFSGVGTPPQGREDLGHCSQIATFTLQASPSSSSSELQSIGTPYSVVAEVIYPYEDQPLSQEMKLCHEVAYHLNKLAQLKRTGDRGSEEDQSDAGGRGEGDYCSHCGCVLERWTVHVALKDVLKEPGVQKLCTSLEEIRSALVLSLSISLDQTKTCAIFEELDKLSDCSDSSNQSDHLAEQSVNSAVSDMPVTEVCDVWQKETEECWD